MISVPRDLARALGLSRAIPVPESLPDLARLLALRHPNPHSILGAHQGPDGWTVRAFRPDAARMRVGLGDGVLHEMARSHSAGLFETHLWERASFFYRLWILDSEGKAHPMRDPYSFLPTVSEPDLERFSRGRHGEVHRFLGAHEREVDGIQGVSFALWAPGAEGVSVVGEFNRWDGRIHPMRMLGSSGVWELFIPELAPGALYKFEIHGADGRLFLKSDPCGFSMEAPPGTASRIDAPRHAFRDGAWREQQAKRDLLRRPLSIYEVHLGSWRRVPEEGNRPMTYREIAPLLAEYVRDLGFTHVELLPLMEHPYGPSWGYQVGGYFAPTARFGSPDDFRFLVDFLHRQGVGVLLDWVPAHFPKDASGLGRFDGTALYEHSDRRLGEHPDWGTYIFNYGRHEVRDFLLSNARYWLSEHHVDGLRLDAVASMLYRDYSRAGGDWIPNEFGGREDLQATAFLKELNEVCHREHPGVLMVAEESTSWPGVSRPTYAGGLGFGFKWNMGWMHDTLSYFSRDPIYRRHHQDLLTFGLLYAWSENFILPLSHDEVVHGKGSLLGRMPGDRRRQFSNLRALYAYMWAHPGKKLLFMGGEFGQWNEWNHAESLDWHLLDGPDHRGVQALVRDLNRIYAAEPALWEADTGPAGFEWIDCSNADANVVAFLRIAPSTGRRIVCVCNLSPVLRTEYRLGLPRPGWYAEILNTDSTFYGGGGAGNRGGVMAEPVPWQGRPHSARLELPPLSVVWLEAHGP